MAKTVSEEEIQLRKRARRRLVGAIALVIAAVVILPMVLDSKPEQRSHEIDIRIPSEDSPGELAPETVPTTEAPVTAVPGNSAATAIQQEDQIASRSSAKPAQSLKESVEKQDAVTEGRNPEPKVESGTAKTGVATDDASLFVVQLGAFSDPVKARQQLQSLISKDIKAQTNAKAYTETVKAGKGEITRVRLGSFRTREEAESTREKLKKLGFEGVVTEK